MSGQLVNFDQAYCNCVLDGLLDLEGVFVFDGFYLSGVSGFLNTRFLVTHIGRLLQLFLNHDFLLDHFLPLHIPYDSLLDTRQFVVHQCVPLRRHSRLFREKSPSHLLKIRIILHRYLIPRILRRIIRPTPKFPIRRRILYLLPVYGLRPLIQRHRTLLHMPISRRQRLISRLADAGLCGGCFVEFLAGDGWGFLG